jgi:hypothetical protein
MRRLLSCFLIPLLPALSHAAGALTVGAGVNYSSTNDKALFQPASPPAPPGYVPDPEARPGYNVGIGYERDALRGLGFAAGLGLETRGENATITHPNPAAPVIEGELRMLYLQLPVLALVRFPAGRFRLGGYGGPSAGVLLSGKKERRVDGVTQPTEKANVRKLDFGIEAGGTVECELGRGAIFARPGYYWGLVEFSRDHSAEHRAARLTLGYMYPL